MALNFFPSRSKEDALEFLEKRPDLDNARVKLLIDLGRILEAADIYAKNGNMLKAVKILSAPATYSTDHARRTIEYLLTGLRRSLTFGVHPGSSPTASKLLGYADRLDRSVMTKQEIDEVSPAYPFHQWVLHPRTSSLQCSKQSNVLTVQVSARSPRLSLRWKMTLLLCYAWTISSHPLSDCETSHFTGFKHRSPFSLTMFT